MRFLPLAQKENTQSSFFRYAEKIRDAFFLGEFYLNALNVSNVRLNNRNSYLLS
jgi:hypothetical protein